MQLGSRPLLDNAQAQALFVGRELALQQLERSMRLGYNCLVVGPPGSGKTSLVRAVMFRSHAADRPQTTMVVRAIGVQSAAEVLSLVLRALRGSREGRTTPVDAGATPIDLIDRLAELVPDRAEADPKSQVIVVEDISAAAGAQLFGALRDELWQVGVQWLVTTSSTHAAGLRRPPADVFFETTVELAALSPTEGADLLRRRLTEQQFAELWEWVPAAALETPRRLLEMARELTEEAAVGGGRLNIGKGLAARSAALAAQSRPAQMLAQELEALGWASASDEQLLTRLGWTRPRVVQVMAELAQGGLVDMREESTGRGRPRKLYRVKPASDFMDPTDPAAPGDPGSP